MYQYNAKVWRVIDGDTVDAMIDLGFDVWVKRRIRLAGINTPEIRTRDKKQKQLGLEAKARLIEIFKENDNEFLLISHGVGKYGRCLGEIHTTKNYIRAEKYHGKSVNELLIKEGHAEIYEC